MNPFRRKLCQLALLTPALALTGVRPSHAQRAPVNDPNAPVRLRGYVAGLDSSALMLRMDNGRNLKVALPESCPVFALSKASFTEVDYGAYVGAVSEKLGDHVYSPIVRDSLSWLHRGFELRFVDDSLRGIALGHQTWDRTPQSVMTHGWIDDIEGRVMSIKYGPTEEEETDVEFGRNIPILRMSQGSRDLLRPAARVLVGAQRGADPQAPTSVFIFAGKDGVIPPL